MCIVNRTLRTRAVFLTTFAFFSFLAVCPGFYFRPHYFILVLPAVSLLVGVAVTSITNRLRSVRSGLRFIPALTFAVALGFPIWHEKDFFFERSVPDAYRMVYGTNPFAESVKIA